VLHKSRKLVPFPTILIADDIEANRYVLRRILEGANCLVEEADTRAEAERVIFERNPEVPFSLLILDVQYPDGNGYDLCESLKADSRTAHIPILLMSAVFTENMDHVQGLKCGADSYLVQPVDPGVLIATVRAMLRIGKS